jgi:S1-C subfamily serine protease/predicted Fe-Mo cluster-binding NifX family protein
MIWLAPVTVLAFVVLLAVMYGWVGTVDNTGMERPEQPEAALANNLQIQTPQDNLADGLTAQQGQNGQVVHHTVQVPAGIGNDPIQLINGNPNTPGGGQPGFDGQVPVGVGNDPIQLLNHPTFSTGIGNQQIQLINQNQLNGGLYLGIDLSEINPAAAQDPNLADKGSLYVNAVLPGSPSQKAGLSTGDIVLKCDGQTVNSLAAMRQILGQKQAGDVIKLVVNRDGMAKSYHVKLENAPMGLPVGTTQNPTWMGADIQNIDGVMKIRFNLPDQKGAVVTHVAPDSPAAAAGLQTGDVVRRLAETRIRDVEQLQSMISKAQPGQMITLTVLRNAEHQTVNLTLGRQPLDTGKQVPVLPPGDMAIEGSWIGMDVTELSPNDAAGMKLAPGTTGILVNDVEGPPATSVGFQTGDVIIAVNGIPTPDMKQFVAATQQQAGAVVDVIRGNRHLFMSVPPPGFTAQGTPLNIGLDQRFKQVAMTRAAPQKVALITSGPGLGSRVAGDASNPLYLIMVDPSANAFTVLSATDPNQVPGVLGQYQVGSLICSDVSPGLARTLSANGITVYSGVVGSTADAIGLYQSNRLIAARGQ